MPRQFFVGGNFKLNPVTQEQKRSLVKTLNEATIDPAVGKQSIGRIRLNLKLNPVRRGRDRPSVDLFDLPEGHPQEGDQGGRAELLLQALGSLHRRDQVRFLKCTSHICL